MIVNFGLFGTGGGRFSAKIGAVLGTRLFHAKFAEEQRVQFFVLPPGLTSRAMYDVWCEQTWMTCFVGVNGKVTSFDC
jgi:hypothetical protein